MAERTGKRAASNASKTLRSKSATKAQKSAAASALAQVGNNKVTRSKAGSAAGKALSKSGASKAAKSAAGSALTQRSKKRG